jgi:hypothetical protein
MTRPEAEREAGGCSCAGGKLGENPSIRKKNDKTKKKIKRKTADERYQRVLAAALCFVDASGGVGERLAGGASCENSGKKNDKTEGKTVAKRCLRVSAAALCLVTALLTRPEA